MSSSSAALQVEAAEQLGISDRTLQRWKREPWFPTSAIDADGRYDVETIRAAAAEVGKGKTKLDEAARGVKLKRELAELRLKEARAREAERDEQRQLGNILDRDEFETALREIIGNTRDRLMTLPGRLSKLPSVRDRTAFLAECEAEIRKALHAMAAEIEHVEERVSQEAA